MLSILLPAARRTGPGEDPQAVWGDLRVALASVQAYAGDVEVVVGWNGQEEPRHLPVVPGLRLLEQDEGIHTGSEAWNWCASQTDADDLLILGDDCVLHPDTIRLFREDVEVVERQIPGIKLGWLGARSNYVKGPQNIRSSNDASELNLQYDSEGLIVATEMIVPVAGWIRHSVYDETGGFPATNWFADDLMSWDLQRLGYRHFVSRAYVHHVGQRATGQGKGSETLLAEGLQWLHAHRPDFLVEKLGHIAQGAVS